MLEKLRPFCRRGALHVACFRRREVIGERSVPALFEERSHADERVGSDGIDGRRIEEVLMSQMVEAFPSPHEAGH